MWLAGHGARRAGDQATLAMCGTRDRQKRGIYYKFIPTFMGLECFHGSWVIHYVPAFYINCVPTYEVYLSCQLFILFYVT